jgi:hypothetical protein
MTKLRSVLALVIVAAVLTGCGTLKKFTGQRDDTILPGAREDVLTPEQQRNKRPGTDKDLEAPPDAISTENLQ